MTNLLTAPEEIQAEHLEFPSGERASAASSNGRDSAVTFDRVFSGSAGAGTTLIALRAAARATTKVSQHELDGLLRERAALVERKYLTGLTSSEANRLAYVRWSLDRIEDVRSGAELDSLEAAVENFKQFATEMRHLRADLNGALKSSSAK